MKGVGAENFALIKLRNKQDRTIFELLEGRSMEIPGPAFLVKGGV